MNRFLGHDGEGIFYRCTLSVFRINHHVICGKFLLEPFFNGQHFFLFHCPAGNFIIIVTQIFPMRFCLTLDNNNSHALYSPFISKFQRRGKFTHFKLPRSLTMSLSSSSMVTVVDPFRQKPGLQSSCVFILTVLVNGFTKFYGTCNEFGTYTVELFLGQNDFFIGNLWNHGEYA